LIRILFGARTWKKLIPPAIGVSLLGLAVSPMALAQTRKAEAKPVAAQTAAEPLKAIGSKSAPITMEVFSDYQCPSCRTLFEQTLRPMINDYVAAGKVYLVHRDFPLPMHRYSHDAARWVNAAAKIGKYPEVEAALYDNQNAWSADGNIEKYVAGALTSAELKRVEKIMEGCQAEAPGVKPARLSGAAQAGQGCSVDGAIEKDVALGRLVPVNSTPTYIFVYKGQRYPPASGIVSWPILKQFFDQLLSQ
jgi:protein-disulfide isomerase